MLYAMIAEMHPDVAVARSLSRPAHLARLEELKAAGRLVLAGPFPAIDAVDPGPAGFTGSLIVAEFDTQLAAQAWADNDPYVKAGVYANIIAKPFLHVLP
ncbi:YciI family protein [Iodobacter sp. CM08]|uniref:YciI family protein n=1 Tax=Iodobacter sp. CM08 TaxID=3085902 RepID=UPI0029810848|nr:YciI family protein [Iodobacter sp. CM08]MDW5417258.1 YciI family protein [Iodobacter sp. CM08]